MDSRQIWADCYQLWGFPQSEFIKCLSVQFVRSNSILVTVTWRNTVTMNDKLKVKWSAEHVTRSYRHSTWQEVIGITRDRKGSINGLYSVSYRTVTLLHMYVYCMRTDGCNMTSHHDAHVTESCNVTSNQLLNRRTLFWWPSKHRWRLLRAVDEFMKTDAGSRRFYEDWCARSTNSWRLMRAVDEFHTMNYGGLF